MSTSQQVSANVRAELGRQNLKAVALARRSDIPIRTLYRLLNGSRAWEIDTIQAVADVLAVDWVDLVKTKVVAA